MKRTLRFVFFVAAPLLVFFSQLAAQEQSHTFPTPSQGEPSPIYDTLSPDKSLLSSSRFIVIDDFNAGRLENLRGGSWRTKSAANGALDLFIDKVDARNQARGYSLKARFHLYPKESTAFQSLLKQLDVSRAGQLVFKYKLQTEEKAPFNGRIEIQLSDWKHKNVRKDITKFCAANCANWREVALPVSFFDALDLDQLSQIQFKITAGNEKMAGSWWVDEIAFFGTGDIGFESNRDNLLGFPAEVLDPVRRLELQAEKNDKKLLHMIARDTWRYFENARDLKTHLVADHLRLGEAPLIGGYTSPTNIAMDLMSLISAMDLGFISEAKAREEAAAILSTLEKMRRYRGFFYNFYETKKLAVTRSYISSVDSGWLAIALVVLRQTFEGAVAQRASKILDAFSFGEFMDPENNQLVVGIKVPEKDFGKYHYGMLVTEARATSLYAIGKGDLPPSHWWFLYRTPPTAWKWQTQPPRGFDQSRDGIDYFQGYYQYRGRKFVPSWGGSLFEYLMPTLVLKERKLAPKGLGLNNKIATELHRDYALREMKYPVWGISSAATSNGRNWRYGEYGVRAFGAKGYPERGVITPHVSFLALDSLPKDAVKNVRKLLHYEIYGEYGFYDSIAFPKGQVNTQYLALDQGMTLIAICNYLKDGSIQKRFHKDIVGKNAEKLLKESFFSRN